MTKRSFYVERVPKNLIVALDSIRETIHMVEKGGTVVTLVKVEHTNPNTGVVMTYYRNNVKAVTNSWGSSGNMSEVEYNECVAVITTEPLVLNSVVVTSPNGDKAKLTKLPYEYFECLTYLTFYDKTPEESDLPSWLGTEFSGEICKMLEYSELHDIINEHKYIDIRLLLEPYVLVASRDGGSR